MYKFDLKQLQRSGTSVSLNYGEAQSGGNLVPGKTAQRIVTSGEAGTLVYSGAVGRIRIDNPTSVS